MDLHNMSDVFQKAFAPLYRLPLCVFYGNEFLVRLQHAAAPAATPKCDVNQIYITKIKRYEPFNSDWKDVDRNCFQTFFIDSALRFTSVYKLNFFCWRWRRK